MAHVEMVTAPPDGVGQLSEFLELRRTTVLKVASLHRDLFLQHIKTKVRHWRSDQRQASPLQPQHGLAVGTPAEHVPPIEAEAGRRNRRRLDLMRRLGRNRVWIRKKRADTVAA